ncbi:MAG TPA: hypothetical protein VF190_10950 [Rhodothermales bacterium]
MKPTYILLLSVLLSTLAFEKAAAQWNVAQYGSKSNSVYTTFGLDPALVNSVGYARVIPVKGHAFQAIGELGLATTNLDTRDYRVRLGIRTSVVHWKSLHLIGNATFLTRGTKNDIYRGFNFGADFTGEVGWYRPSWFAAAEFGKDKAVITHVTHTDWYRDNYYPDAKDGWYLDAGGTYHFGLAGGVTVLGADIVGRVGLRQTEQFNSINPPLYASLGVAYGF